MRDCVQSCSYVNEDEYGEKSTAIRRSFVTFTRAVSVL